MCNSHFFDVFLFLASQCVNVSRTKVGKIEISGNKKDMALEKLSCAAICYISFAESFSANSLISLFKNTESTVLTPLHPGLPIRPTLDQPQFLVCRKQLEIPIQAKGKCQNPPSTAVYC